MKSSDGLLAAFARLLGRYLEEGRRPGRAKGERWTHVAFAHTIARSRREVENVSPRSVSNWCKGLRLPMQIEPILEALFAYDDQSLERANLDKAYREAHAKASSEILKRAKPRKDGATWVMRGRRLVMTVKPNREDNKVAADSVHQQFQQEVRDRAQKLADKASEKH